MIGNLAAATDSEVKNKQFIDRVFPFDTSSDCNLVIHQPHYNRSTAEFSHYNKLKVKIAILRATQLQQNSIL